ncbi:MAG: site-specific DNA-methyltransferase, partial [Butyrivibrio sp.]|nr:site-specific DNA-methyltransferase [Butyrivibrio sp.]
IIQVMEEIDEKEEAYKEGYRFITEIGQERIRRVFNKLQDEEKKLDLGFRVFKVDDGNMNKIYYSVDRYSQGMVAALESNIKSDRSDLDLLFGCLIDWGLPLSMPYKSETLGGAKVHTYNDGDLIACFDENIPEEVIKEIAKRQPLRAVFRDSSFANSPAKINVGEIFKLLAPDTSVKVI